MKRYFVLTILLVYNTLQLFAQDLERSYVPYYIQDGEVHSFEYIGAEMESGTPILSDGNSTANIASVVHLTVFKKPNSTVRFKSNSLPKLLIKVDDEDFDLSEMILIVKSKARDGKPYRKFEQSWGIAPELKKVSPNIYQIILSGLLPGEYSFRPIMKNYKNRSFSRDKLKMVKGLRYQIWCFAIDE